MSLTLVVLSFSAVDVCWGDPNVPENKSADAAAGSQPRDGLDQGPIEKSTSIIGSKVVSADGATAGIIRDLMLDLQHGHVSLAIIKLEATKDAESRLVALPWHAMQRSENGVLSASLSADNFENIDGLDAKQFAGKATRRWAERICREMKSSQRELPKGENSTNDDELLIRATALDDGPVQNLDGLPLGYLAGFAVSSRDGLLVYAALSENKSDRHLRAIPLSAFIVKPSQKDWIIDISKKSLEERPTFPGKEWPESIDRGWFEYVHVLYGRPVFEGVRSASREATPSQ